MDSKKNLIVALTMVSAVYDVKFTYRLRVSLETACLETYNGDLVKVIRKAVRLNVENIWVIAIRDGFTKIS